MLIKLMRPMFYREMNSGAGGGAPDIGESGGGSEPAIIPNATEPSGNAIPGNTGVSDAQSSFDPSKVDWSKVDVKTLPEDVREKIALEHGPEWFGKRLKAMSDKSASEHISEANRLRTELEQLRNGVGAAKPEVDTRFNGVPADVSSFIQRFEKLSGDVVSGIDLENGVVNIGTEGDPEEIGFKTMMRIINTAEGAARSVLQDRESETAKSTFENQVMSKSSEVEGLINDSLNASIKSLFSELSPEHHEFYSGMIQRDVVEKVAGYIQENRDFPDPEYISSLVAAETKRFADMISAPNQLQQKINNEARGQRPVDAGGAEALMSPKDERSMSKMERRQMIAQRSQRVSEQIQKQMGVR